jgi:parallel beta-helix repeat protein
MTTPRALVMAILALACGGRPNGGGSSGDSVSPSGRPPSSGAALSVGDFGARGDGQALDTAAIQAAVDALPVGGVLRFGPGTYRIDAATGIRLKDDSRLDLGQAVITGENVDGARCRLLEIDGRRNVVISGGTLVGSRSGSPAWGVGILASDADNLLIENVTFRDFYFDGVLLTGNRGCRDVVLRGVVAENNRRTGLAVPSAQNVTVEDSTFRGTRGQSPEAGANCEPNPGGEVRGVLFRRSTFAGNAGVGLYMHRGKGDAVADVSVQDSTVEGNGQGIVAAGAENVSIVNNHVSGHRRPATSGIVVGDTSAAMVSGNRLDGNFRGILAAHATNVQIQGNTVEGPAPGSLPAGSADANGIVCLGPTPGTDPACVIVSNSVHGSPASSIVVQQVSLFRLQDNTIEQSGQRGLLLSAASRGEARGNSILTSGLQGAAYAAIELAQSSSDNVVANNVIRFGSGSRLGIQVCPACRRNEITGNQELP